LLDGYSGYNQIAVCEEDKEKYIIHHPMGNIHV
jgi:hypothetical protein